MAEDLSAIPGFTLDDANPNTGWFCGAGGQLERVYLKRSRSLARHANEKAALVLLSGLSEPIPIPRLIADAHTDSGPVLLLSFVEGVNLADLVCPSPEAPPRPPWYQAAAVVPLPSIQDLAGLLAQLGRCVRAMHSVRLGRFGKLVGEEPNPYQSNAYDFTRQELVYHIQSGAEKGFLPPRLAQAALEWAAKEIEWVAETEAASFVHFDLHSGNVRVCQDPADGVWKLRALYDFEIARGWLPECDLAAFHWDLAYLEGDATLAWRSFVAGYGPVDARRLRLFEGLRAITAIAYTERYPVWSAWCVRFLERLLHEDGWL